MSTDSVPVVLVSPPGDMNGQSVTKLDSLLHDFLADRGMAHLNLYAEALKKIEKVVNPLLNEIRKRDKRLHFEPMSPSGYYQVLRHNVLEIFIVLKKLNYSKVDIVEVDSGMACVGLKQAKHQHSWHDLIERDMTREGFFLSSAMLRQYLNSFLQDIAKEKGILEPNVWVDCTNNERDGLVLNISYEGEQFYVHLTPAIFAKGFWPDCGVMWKKVMFRWPEDNIRKRVVEEGTHLVCRPIKSITQHSSITWSLSFLGAEKYLLHMVDSGCRNKCLQILKTVLENTLSYPCGLTPYHIETVTLHLNSLISNPSLWQDVCLTARFLDLLSALHKSLTQESCSHFFAPSIQLFSHIPSSVLKTLAARVKHIIDSPVEYFQTFYRATLTTQF